MDDRIVIPPLLPESKMYCAFCGRSFISPTEEERLSGIIDRASHEITALRAMLPQKVDGLPTEAGWYWFYDKVVDGWGMVRVICDGMCEFIECGRRWIEETDKMVACTWYGPLTPPDISSGAEKKVEVNE